MLFLENFLYIIWYLNLSENYLNLTLFAAFRLMSSLIAA